MAEMQSPVVPALVFVPNLRVDRGMGHLKRCLAAAASAGGSAAVLWSDNPVLTEKRPVFALPAVRGLADELGVRLLEEWPEGSKADTVVADLQSAGLPAFRFLRNRAEKLIGWDMGGSSRARFPFLVDSLPHQTEPASNLYRPGLLGLEIRSPSPADRRIRKILAVFGGADPAGLTVRFLAMVESLRDQKRWPFELTVVRGPMSRFAAPDGVEVLDSPPNLVELLAQSDLTVTSWGLTALESLAAGTPVLLFNPTAYHERLSRKAGLPTFGVRRPRVKDFWAGLESAPAVALAQRDSLVHQPEDAGQFFAVFDGSDGRCPVCRTSGHRVFARTEHKSYHHCRVCGMEYLSAHRLPKKVYSDAYFFEDYQKQYGKTYLEDFAHIQNLGRQRLSFLDKTFGPRSSLRILDAGCAFGPFLAAVSEAGHQPFGLDIAEGAVRHVREVLKFRAVRASFPEFRWEEAFQGAGRPDVVTLWYVIEHFQDLDAVLSQANRLLPVGGVLAFSTPNGRGITRTFQPAKFWKESPDDHFSIWSPANAGPVLKRFGFQAVQFRITGRHPERFPFAKNPSPFARCVVEVSDKCFGWGDTFEVYARKTKELR